jgi:hypothetical protein
MAEMGPREYANKYWDMDVAIINDDNDFVRWDKVAFNKYRLHMGWLQNPVVYPPGLMDFLNAIDTYAAKLFKQDKRLDLRVKNVWGETNIYSIATMESFKKLHPRATAAFSGKGSPEDVQLTLQLAARCNVAPEGLQQYCDKKVDTYARLGLDCNGFVGNYLQYRSDKTKWDWGGPKKQNLASTGVKDIVDSLGTKPITKVDDMINSRIFVLGLVDTNTRTVINQFSSSGGVAHIVITEAINWGSKAVYPPVPKQYLNGRYIHYSTIESTPAVGLSASIYGVLELAGDGVATVWRGRSELGVMNVKIYPMI